MNALVMCGGAGSRYDRPVEKPLVEIGGVPMVDRVVRAIEGSRIEAVTAVVSPAAPATAGHVRERLATIETEGNGYVADLRRALEGLSGPGPVLTVAADLPLLTGSLVDSVLDRADERPRRGSATVGVPVERKRSLGLRIESVLPVDPTVAPSGVNVVDPTPVKRPTSGPRTAAGDVGTDRDASSLVVVDDPRLAVNVNRPRDAMIAEALL